MSASRRATRSLNCSDSAMRPWYSSIISRRSEGSAPNNAFLLGFPLASTTNLRVSFPWKGREYVRRKAGKR